MRKEEINPFEFFGKRALKLADMVTGRKLGMEEEEQIILMDYEVDNRLRNPLLWIDNILQNDCLDLPTICDRPFIAILLDLTLY